MSTDNEPFVEYQACRDAMQLVQDRVMELQATNGPDHVNNERIAELNLGLVKLQAKMENARVAYNEQVKLLGKALDDLEASNDIHELSVRLAKVFRQVFKQEML